MEWGISQLGGCLPNIQEVLNSIPASHKWSIILAFTREVLVNSLSPLSAVPIPSFSSLLTVCILRTAILHFHATYPLLAPFPYSIPTKVPFSSLLTSTCTQT